jgi:hypothetical protein
VNPFARARSTEQETVVGRIAPVAMHPTPWHGRLCVGFGGESALRPRAVGDVDRDAVALMTTLFPVPSLILFNSMPIARHDADERGLDGYRAEFGRSQTPMPPRSQCTTVATLKMVTSLQGRDDSGVRASRTSRRRPNGTVRTSPPRAG